MKTFAADIPRDSATGWLLFPRDAQYRKSLFFPDEVADHPAKMNLHLQKAIIDYVAQPGDTLLDPFGGTGSLLIACLEGMRVILLEIEEGYHQLQQQAVDKLMEQHPECKSMVTLLYGDNRFLMPVPCNHIITSPPYASMMRTGTMGTKRMKENPDDEFAKMDKQMQAYTKSSRNIGKLNNFLYNQTMVKVYNLCYKSLLPGGTLTIILKDRIVGGKRVLLTEWAKRVCIKAGFKEAGRWKWKTPGIQFTAINKLHGLEVVEDESIMIFRRP